MKTGRWTLRMWLTVVALGWAGPAVAANTDGTVNFTVTTANYTAQYSPNNVAVVWVVDSSNKFVKTLRRFAGTRINYLSRWISSRGSYTAVDGTTGATLTAQPQTHAVTWNCRDTNNAVVPDGMYYFKVEYTSANGDGPYLTNGVGFLKSTAPVTTNYPNSSSAGGQFMNMSLTYAPVLPDVAVVSMSPASGIVNTPVSVIVAVSNRFAAAATNFTVALSNVTAAASLIATQQVASLAAAAVTNLTFVWNTAGLTAGPYQLMAQAYNLAGETNLANNAYTHSIVLAATIHDVAVNSIVLGAVVPPGMSTNVTVAVSNAGGFVETFAVVLSNLTTGVAIGTRSATNLATGASSNLVFTWSTVGAAIGYHTLQAVAATVAGETLTANNFRQTTVIVANGLETNTLIARGADWKYLNNGLDISRAPWTLSSPASYYDGFWATGPAPLGFGATGIATVIGTAPTVTPGTVLAADAASNTIYATSWANGMNGGSSFGAWQLSAGGTGGHFTWTSTGNAGGSGGIDTGGRSWGLWSSSGVTEAVRPMTGGGLVTGQVLRVDFDHGWVATGRSAGIGLRNTAGSNVWEFFLSGAGGGAAATNLSENFSGFTTEEGTTDRAGSLDSYLQTTGWSGTRIYEDGGRAKMGTRTTKGQITTPTVNLSGNGGAFTLQFNLAKYGSDTGVVQVLHAANGTTFAQVGADMVPPAAATVQTIVISGGTAVSKVQIAAKNVSTNRYYLDNIVLTQDGGSGAGTYYINDSRGPTATAIPFTGNGFQIALQLVGSTNYSASVASGSNVWTYSGALMAQADPVISRIRCWNWEAGTGSNCDVFVNSLSVSNAAVVSTTSNHITTYFRKEFTVDALPIAVTGLVRREDGVVLYLNGQPLDQHNLPVGSVINSQTPASSDLTGAAATNYSAFGIAPSNLAVGRNWLAAEVHLASATAAAKSFDLEIKGIQSIVTKIPALVPVAIETAGAIQYGDVQRVTVTLANTGNVAMACILLIKDAATGSILASQPVPVLVAGETLDVHLSWPTLGLGTGTQTLQAFTVVNGVTNLAGAVSNIVTVTAPDFAPRQVNAAGSLGGWCGAVAAYGATVYLGCGATLEIWDAANPASPVKTGAIRLPGLIEGLVAGGSTVYAAAGASGVHVVDVTTPAAPVHVATFDTSGNAHRLVLSGTTLHIADGLGGVRSLDVSHPAAPVLVGAYASAGAVQTLLQASPNLYVLDSDEGLQIVATNAGSTLLGQARQVTAGLALAGVTGAAIVSDANGGLFRIATTNPAAPAMAASTQLPAAGRALAVSGSALYVAAGGLGILTVNPATLAVMATNAVNGAAADVALAGTTLYVATGFGGAQAWDVSNPSTPAWLGSFGTVVRGADADLAGQTLFVAGDEAGFQVHSLTNLARPEWLGTVSSATNPRCVVVAGTLAYVAESAGGLKIYDISDPVSPSLAGSYSLSELVTVRRLAISGAHLALTDGQRIDLLDVANPAAPVLLASNIPPGYVFDLAASSNHIFAACGGAGLRILDRSTLGLVGTYPTSPDPAASVVLAGSYAYVGNGNATLWTLDVSNPAAPVPVQTSSAGGFAAAATQARVLGVDGRRVATGLDVSAPLTPVSSLNLSNLTFALRIRAQGDVVMVAEDEAGLALFAMGSGDANHNGIPDAIDQQIVDANPNDDLATIWDVLPGADYDGDGTTNLEESLAGTSPTDPTSVFTIDTANHVDGDMGQFVLRWFSEPGKTYTIHQSTNLLTGFTTLESGIAETAPLNTYTAAVPTAETYFIISVP